ncbi:hypothetical protein CCR75_001108 [Bremia lactucae]|uniref:Ubiquitin carboxyl-terminal hydrolase n=1 Tax=Bremia lactucae TaxID=4779 RepID=A0A976FSJ1_BRELC|nr:hypothetical protein CCR75_001108 [Bremia lactucae]
MGGVKGCRHVGQAVRLVEARRELKKRSQLLCQACLLSPSSDPAATALASWAKYTENPDLLVCVSCGFVGCFSDGHFQLHFQVHPKHFVGLQLASKTFWCEPCRIEIPIDVRPKVERARQDFCDVVEDIAAKKKRQIRNQMRVSVSSQTTLSPITTPKGSTRNSLNVDTRTDTPPLAEGSSSSETNLHVDTTHTLLDTPLKTKAREDKIRRKLQKAALDRDLTPEPCVSPAFNHVNEVKTVPLTVLGLTNLGNTCYFNASMQALLTAAHYFPEHMHMDKLVQTKNTPITTTFTMLHETFLKRALNAMTGNPLSERRKSRSSRARSSSSSVLTVAPLLKAIRQKFPQFRGHDQQDAHELFASFLWAIDEEMDPLLPPWTDFKEFSATTDGRSDSISSIHSSPTPKSDKPDGVDESSRSAIGKLHEDDSTDNEYTIDGDHEEDGSESDVEQEETNQILIKSQTGEIIAMQVPKSATNKQLQQLLAKRLNLHEAEILLNGLSIDSCASLSSRQSTVLHARSEKRQMCSQLNLTRTLFGGALTTAVTCQACNNRTEIIEDAFHLSVSVPDTRHRTLTIRECLDTLVAETQLLVDANNGYECEKCSRQVKVRSVAGRFMRKKRAGQTETKVVLRNAWMRLVVSSLPRVLVIHLKRLARSRKITQHVVFDEILDMTPYVSESLRERDSEATTYALCFELIAVIVHTGNKRSGHYSAYVSRSRRQEASALARHGALKDGVKEMLLVPRDEPARVWYYVSDTVVKRVLVEHVLQCEAYMLFYRRRRNDKVIVRATSPRIETECSSTETAL